MKNSLNKSQVERFSRQLVLKNIGPKGQKKIMSSKVLIVGVGGLRILTPRAINNYLTAIETVCEGQQQKTRDYHPYPESHKASCHCTFFIFDHKSCARKETDQHSNH